MKFIKGNIFESEAEGLVNTVNTVGVMGKGIALQFKKLYPLNYKVYLEKCRNKDFRIGELIIVKDSNIISGPKTIINFPTKKHWRNPSQYEFIEQGMDELIKFIQSSKISSIAIPPLGAGNGGLNWVNVKKIIIDKLSIIEDCEISIYEPNSHVKEVLKKERVKLTPARAMLLYMLFKLVRNGEFVSEFASEKLCYFLQRFGGEKYLKLKFSPEFYGPYSGRVRHVLGYLNGSYVSGYLAKDKKPFEDLNLIVDAEKEIVEFIAKDKELDAIVQKTDEFLSGYYSYFSLELLSTIDFIASSKKISDIDNIKQELDHWSDRKKSMFSNDKLIKLSLDQLKQAELV